jgi:hypothetical protein
MTIPTLTDAIATSPMTIPALTVAIATSPMTIPALIVAIATLPMTIPTPTTPTRRELAPNWYRVQKLVEIPLRLIR